MSYTNEQREKNEALIEKEMAEYTHEQKAEVQSQCLQTWANDDEVKALIANKKSEVAMQATPEEMAEVFKDFRL